MKVVKSAGRVLRLLEYFDERRRGVTIMDAARALQCPQSSMSALLQSLVGLGYARYVAGDRTYLPTARVALLGSWVQGNIFANERIPKLMDKLSRRTGHLIILAMERAGMVQYIRIVEATRALRIHLPPGTERPYTRSGAGKIMLTLKPDDVIRRILLKENAEARSGGSRVSLNSLMNEIAVARKAGFASSYNGFTQGAAMVAVPLPSSRDEPLALAIGGPAKEIKEHESDLVDLMKRLVKEHIGPPDWPSNPS